MFATGVRNLHVPVSECTYVRSNFARIKKMKTASPTVDEAENERLKAESCQMLSFLRAYFPNNQYGRMRCGGPSSGFFLCPKNGILPLTHAAKDKIRGAMMCFSTQEGYAPRTAASHTLVLTSREVIAKERVDLALCCFQNAQFALSVVGSWSAHAGEVSVFFSCAYM